MSLLTELGAQVRAASEELPTGLVNVVLDRLRTATELLAWVREASVDPLGVPQLGGATEHAERAAHALLVAQDALAGYLVSIGLAADAPRPGSEPAPQPRPAPHTAAGAPPDAAGGQRPLASWWRTRVGQLTGQPEADTGEAADEGAAAADTDDLLRRVAGGVRARDRARVARELRGVDAALGLYLSAVTPPVLHRLAADLLGHEPRPQDLPRLRDAAAQRVRDLLPGGAPDAVDALLARVCRAPVEIGPAHPADSAVTAGVLTGVLLARLGRGPDALAPAG
jgi:hypothetical protein